MKKRDCVIVIGASNKPNRYSYKAIESLLVHGYEPVPVNPFIKEIKGIKVISDISGIRAPVGTVTLYVGPEKLEPMAEGIISLRPRRIIANPGAESEKMKELAAKAGIEYLEACTLVMLATGQF